MIACLYQKLRPLLHLATQLFLIKKYRNYEKNISNIDIKSLSRTPVHETFFCYLIACKICMYELNLDLFLRTIAHN